MSYGGERAPAGLDTSRPSVARMYDYYLGGKDNFQVDRDAVDRIEKAMPGTRQVAHQNRAFLRRAVRYMARQGVRQFIDIGSGLPTAGNTHEIAQEVDPSARVVYVDNDPVVLNHGRALLAADSRTTVVTADMHRPDEVLEHPEVTRLIDFGRPVGVLMIAMVHFLTLDEQPYVMARLRDALAPGSHFTATHATTDGLPADMVAHTEAVYATTPTPIHFRPRAEIARFFDGFELAPPGLVMLNEWRPDADAPVTQPCWLYGAVGRKP
ncbi:SAM-dependent methyltransferase [Actinoallomurus sp. NBC_01490]|uniref:SAM-dependent methyltransferase n=1 Tax=Actinoallomurus sp. NBC_01490 TaxID=2903557 RepID=UPI002E346844|nr:SAM-dependent methyltransferase [Actinoallomurus sp. NBC_01490]